MKKRNIFLGFLMGLTALSAQGSVVRDIPVSAQKKLTMTIYNAGRALVNDVRAVQLPAGHSALSFVDISNMVMPTSVLFKSSGVKVLEQNFNFDLLTLDSLMQKSVGQSVMVEYINPATGEKKQENAELLSYEGGRPILKIGGKIETAYPGRVIFNQVPTNLSARPSLVFDIYSESALVQDIEVSYLTNGISWSADYVIELDKNSQMDLNGLVTLTNNTSVSYDNVNLQLVAGDVNMVSKSRVMKNSRNVMMLDAAMPQAAYGMEQEAVSGYYLYSLKRPTDILSNQTKQVSLLSGSKINTKKTYQYDSPVFYYAEGVVENVKPTMYLNFANTKANSLGEALPKGIMRVYEKDSRGGLVFVGEDTIDHTAIGQDVRLRLGEDFDITLTGKRTNFKKIDSHTSQAEFEIKISNAKTVAQIVRYNQSLPSGWQMLSESHKSQKETANSVFWNVEVPPEGSVVLTFKVMVVSR